MAITTPTLVAEMPHTRTGPWAVNNDEDDASTAVAMKAAGGADTALYLTHLTLSGQLLDSLIHLEDEDGTRIFGPIQMQADGGGVFSKDWKCPLRVTTNKGISVKCSSATAFTCYIEGFTAQLLP